MGVSSTEIVIIDSSEAMKLASSTEISGSSNSTITYVKNDQTYIHEQFWSAIIHYHETTYIIMQWFE